MRGIEKRNLAKSQNPNPRETPRLKKKKDFNRGLPRAAPPQPKV
jgi:hypothetical protein